MILADICEFYDQPDDSNDVLALNNSIRGVLYHEASHLFTDKLLHQNLGALNQYHAICEDCSVEKITDRIDHMIVFLLQGLMMKRFGQNDENHDFYINTCTDVIKELYQKLLNYHPKNTIPLEVTYRECLDLIKKIGFENQVKMVSEVDF